MTTYSSKSCKLIDIYSVRRTTWTEHRHLKMDFNKLHVKSKSKSSRLSKILEETKPLEIDVNPKRGPRYLMYMQRLLTAVKMKNFDIKL